MKKPRKVNEDIIGIFDEFERSFIEVNKKERKEINREEIKEGFMEVVKQNIDKV